MLDRMAAWQIGRRPVSGSDVGIHRIDAQGLGHHVHSGFDRKADLRITGRPHVPGRHTVGIDRVGVDADIRDAIGAGSLASAGDVDHGCRLEGRISAAIENDPGLTCDDYAFPGTPLRRTTVVGCRGLPAINSSV